MNWCRRVVVFLHGRGLELLLILAVLLLVGQLGWPGVVRWWRLPRAGTIGFDQCEYTGLAREFVIWLPGNYRHAETWPLVVFLHGSGQRGQDPSMLRNSGPLGSQLPAIVAAPQCLPSSTWDPAAVARFVKHVASHYHVDRRRIYLVGYSMGGFGTWHAAAAHSDLFAAIVPICGGGNPVDAKTLVDVPVWAFHGANDQVVPLAASEEMIEAIRDAGGQPKLTTIPDAGHAICETVCRRSSLWERLFQQRRKR